MSTAANLPPIIASRYVPVRLIARGGMGAVYEVEHARTGERLALKVLLSQLGSSAEDLDRFKREARAPARIKSEHVVRVADADIAPELNGAPFLVMELLDGADLEREATSSPPPPATVVEWLRQVARALDKAHGLGIVHRDLKPENLFLAKSEDRPPIVKILDFGILKMIEDGTGGTGSGQILGTPKYMAPEQASTKVRVTSAADRYSLGLVAYRLLTAESYYQGDMMSILAQLLHDPIEPPSRRHPGFGAAFDAWFLKACHRDPVQRFTSASEQIESLSAALGLSHTAGPQARDPKATTPVPRSRRPIVTAIVVAAGLTAVSLVGLFVYRSSATTPTATMPAPSVSPVTPTPTVAATPNLPVPSPATTLQALPPEAPARGTESAVVQPSGGARKARLSRRAAPEAPPGAATVPGTEQPKVPDPYADQK